MIGILAVNWATLPTIKAIGYCAPFVLMLLSIAVLPLVVPRWFHRNSNQAIVAAIFGGPMLVTMIFLEPAALGHVALEYAAFITLLASLFIISGGIFVRGAFAGTPLVNTIFLLVGAVGANVFGTTGAAMLLIRPLLRANRRRKKKMHIFIFFIFIVANCGGCLTPLGDPPLYLGFLKGVPFEWTLTLFFPWLVMVSALLLIFNLLDQYRFNKEDIETRGSLVEDVQPGVARLSLDGKRNFPLLLGVMASILGCGLMVKSRIHAPHEALQAQEEILAAEGTPEEIHAAEARVKELKHEIESIEMQSILLQIILMGTLAIVSMNITPKKIREENEFTFYPIKEVAILFAGIFASMVPALLILKGQAGGFGIGSPLEFFLITGILSSFLDNAPTYLVFFNVAQGLPAAVPPFVASTGIPADLLVGISLGAVFMGANTYIGNGPNFMVKSIVESANVKMPSFFAYMLWSGFILSPLFALVIFVFLR